MRATVNPSAFTRLELLVIISAIQVLAALLFPALQGARANDKRVQCFNNMKQLGIAAGALNDAYRSLPPLAAATNHSSSLDSKGIYRTENTGYTLFVWMVPFIQAGNVYNTINAAKGVTPDTAKLRIKAYSCPEDTSSPHGVTPNGTQKDVLGYAVGNYLANYLVFGDATTGSFQGQARIPGSFPDGTSKTIIFSEAIGTCGSEAGSLWADIDLSNAKAYSYLPAMCVCAANGVAAAKGNPGQRFPKENGRAAVCRYSAEKAFQVTPAPKNCSPNGPSSPHPSGGIGVVLGDGSVRAINPKISPKTWDQACDPRDGAALGGDW